MEPTLQVSGFSVPMVHKLFRMGAEQRYNFFFIPWANWIKPNYKRYILHIQSLYQK